MIEKQKKIQRWYFFNKTKAYLFSAKPPERVNIVVKLKNTKESFVICQKQMYINFRDQWRNVYSGERFNKFFHKNSTNGEIYILMGQYIKTRNILQKRCTFKQFPKVRQ